MPLKHSIVGLLIERPMHGYEIKRVLSPALHRNEQVNDGVLYPLLARLEGEGLVEKRVVAGDGRPNRHVFHPTRKGRAWFAAWLDGTGGEEDDVRYDFLVGHPFLAKCMFFDRLETGEVRRKLEAHKRASENKLGAFARIRAGMVERGVSRYRIAVLDLGIAQQEEKIRWLDRLIDSTSPRLRQPRKQARRL